MTKYNCSVTQERLKELFYYEPKTGNLVRRVTAGGQKAGLVAGSSNVDGYTRITVDGVKYQAHRLIWLYVYGAWPENEIDHIQHIENDNRLSKLRSVTRKENSKNKAMFSNNTSGTVGIQVYYSKTKGARYLVDVAGCKRGTYDTLEEAVTVRDTAYKEYGFHPNHGKKRVAQTSSV